MRHALITGGAGFIGSHLTRRLLECGWRVRVLDDLSTGRADNLPQEAELVLGDVRDEEACRRACRDVSHVFHLAARVTVRQSVVEFVEDAEVNLLGTIRLLRAAGQSRVSRFLQASSMAVYDEGPTSGFIDEEYPTRPRSPYGLSKLSAEQYVHLTSSTLGLEPVVLRFFNTYGPGQAFTPYVGVLTIFATRWLRGETCTIFGDGEQRRDFVHVEDVAEACRLAGETPSAAGRTINVGTGVATTVRQLADAIRRELGGGALDFAEAQPAELRSSVANIALAQALLGYQPTRRLESELPEVIGFIRERLAVEHS